MTADLVLDRTTAGAEPRWGTITELLAEAAARYPDRSSSASPGRRRSRFAEVPHVVSNRLARVLAAHGVQPRVTG